MGSDVANGLVVAVLSMVGTLLALGLIALLTWLLGRYLRDPEAAAPASPPPAATPKAGG